MVNEKPELPDDQPEKHDTSQEVVPSLADATTGKMRKMVKDPEPDHGTVDIEPLSFTRPDYGLDELLAGRTVRIQRKSGQVEADWKVVSDDAQSWHVRITEGTQPTDIFCSNDDLSLLIEQKKNVQVRGRAYKVRNPKGDTKLVTLDAIRQLNNFPPRSPAVLWNNEWHRIVSQEGISSAFWLRMEGDTSKKNMIRANCKELARGNLLTPMMAFKGRRPFVPEELVYVLLPFGPKGSLEAHEMRIFYKENDKQWYVRPPADRHSSMLCNPEIIAHKNEVDGSDENYMPNEEEFVRLRFQLKGKK